METRAHHILIGAFTLAAFLAAAGFVLWLSKYGADKENAYYDVIFKESVTGLSRGGMVQYNGITVGEVVRLSLDPQDPGKVVTRVRLGARTPVKVDTTAVLAYTGVTGVGFIQLSGGKPESAPLQASPGQDFPQIIAQESAFSKLLASGDDIVTSVNDALLRVGKLLSEKNVDSVAKVLSNLDNLTTTLSDQRQDLSHALTQLAAATDQLRTTLTTFDGMAGNVNVLLRDDAPALVASLQQALQDLERLADGVASLVTDNRAAVDAFSQSGLRQVGPALDDLRTTLRSLDRAAERIGSSDSRLLGSRQPKEFKPE